MHLLRFIYSLARVGCTGPASEQHGRHCGASKQHHIRSSGLAPITRDSNGIIVLIILSKGYLAPDADKRIPWYVVSWGRRVSGCRY